MKKSFLSIVVIGLLFTGCLKQDAENGVIFGGNSGSSGSNSEYKAQLLKDARAIQECADRISNADAASMVLNQNMNPLLNKFKECGVSDDYIEASKESGMHVRRINF